MVDADISVDEVYSYMAVNKSDATVRASSSGTEQSFSRLPLVPQVTGPDVALLSQQSPILPFFAEATLATYMY